MTPLHFYMIPQIAIRRFVWETLYHQNQSAISVIWILKTWNFCPLPLISRFKVSTILFLALIRFPPTPFVLCQIFFLDGFHYRKQFLSSAYRVSPGPTSWNSFFHSFRIQFFCLNDQAHIACFTSAVARVHLWGSSGVAQRRKTTFDGRRPSMEDYLFIDVCPPKQNVTHSLTD